MSAKNNLEDQIRSSYGLIFEYEKIIQTTDRPEERLRSKRQIEEQKKLLEEHLFQYISLCQRIETKMSQDIVEIANFAKIPIPTIKKNHLPAKTNRRKRPKVFISYSRSDFIVANEICEFLRANDCVPWLDKHDLLPGQDWKLEIYKNIKTSDYFIACLSKHSVSKVGYVQKELKDAISVLDEIPESRIFLIPIRLDNCIVPVSLENKQWLDWSTPDAKERLLQAIESKK